MDKLYELAIKTGDLSYIDEVVSTEGHIDVRSYQSRGISMVR